ncbi:hypothetical protein GW17_00023298 [Ensete ventricosum]|nr:hypothetical protein GW17_00023298 [Ensete ventricosum]RZR92502.1 hypothetical protein BHM03_00020813 [Ensete ventricosum]
MSSSGRHTFPFLFSLRDRTRPSIGMMMISGSVTSTALPTHGVAVRVAFAPLSRQMKWLQGKASNRRACIEKGFFNGGIEFSYDDKSSPAMNGWESSDKMHRDPSR